jgi:hypothetical protein
MPFSSGNIAHVHSRGTDISQYITSVSVNIERDIKDIKPIGGARRTKLVGSYSGTISLEGGYDPTLDGIMSALVLATTPATSTFSYHPSGGSGRSDWRQRLRGVLPRGYAWRRHGDLAVGARGSRHDHRLVTESVSPSPLKGRAHGHSQQRADLGSRRHRGAEIESRSGAAMSASAPSRSSRSPRFALTP